MKYKEVPDITLKMIIERGIIQVGTKVYSSPDYKTVGTLDKEGAITFKINNKIKTFPYPSGAARALTKTSVNGWIYWSILEKGKYYDLSYYKEKYRLRGHT